jgi:hypothetical protein
MISRNYCKSKQKIKKLIENNISILKYNILYFAAKKTKLSLQYYKLKNRISCKLHINN